MADDLPKPESRKESYLAKAAGMSDVELPEGGPKSREEQYLNAIAEGGGGGGGGTSNFNQLTNRPKYNGTTMTGDTNIPEVKTYTAGTNVAISAAGEISATDTTYSAFTGTDGTSAGTSGLVPAPATTDSGKFLKADGTWDAAGGGGGDTVYSSKTTSNSATGGAVYIGNLNSSQEEQPDPSATDNHYKYFWALPADNTYKPTNNSINILGLTHSAADNSVVIGSKIANGSKVWGSSGVAIGADSNAGQYSIAIGTFANAGKTPDNISAMIAIGQYAVAAVDKAITIGGGGSNYGVLNANSKASMSLGYGAKVGDSSHGYKNSVALGAYSKADRQGEVNVGLVTGETAGGYNNTAYRVIGGVHDPVDAHDAATKGYVDQTLTTLFIDTTNLPSDPNTPLTGQCFYKEKELLNTYSLSEIRDRILNGNVRLCSVDLNNLSFYNFTIISCATDNLTINLQVHDLGNSSVMDFMSDENTQDEFTFSINQL